MAWAALGPDSLIWAPFWNPTILLIGFLMELMISSLGGSRARFARLEKGVGGQFVPLQPSPLFVMRPSLSAHMGKQAEQAGAYEKGSGREGFEYCVHKSLQICLRSSNSTLNPKP